MAVIFFLIKKTSVRFFLPTAVIFSHKKTSVIFLPTAVPQDRDSVAGPTQVLPHSFGGGLVQLRLRV